MFWVVEADSLHAYYGFIRIVKLHYGKDIYARRANRKTVTKELNRTTVKLAAFVPLLGAKDV